MDLTKPDPNSPAARRANQNSNLANKLRQPYAQAASELENAAADSSVYSVSQLNREARLILEHGLPNIVVEGEISNLSQPASGHWYFSLKDNNAQIRCAMFRQRNRLVRPAPKAGDKVQLKGKLTLYEARGDYQLVAEQMQAAGEGALQQAYEALRQKLLQQGLFDEGRKQALPTWPHTIGLITSETGAAVRDMIDVLQRRYSAGQIVLYPSAVQGDAAPAELRRALQQAQQHALADVLIIGRGGGSLEDLWAFNDEALVYDIANCSIPIVSAVGHETDFTLCDFVADLRAPTPSAAAELVSPNSADWINWLNGVENDLERQLQRLLQQAAQRLDQSQHRLQQQHPLRKLELHQQRLNSLNATLRQQSSQRFTRLTTRLQQLELRLNRNAPQQRLAPLKQQLSELEQRLINSANRITLKQQQQLQRAAAKLEVVSPLATLQRGYAIASTRDGKTLTSTQQVTSGDTVALKVADGDIDCYVA